MVGSVDVGLQISTDGEIPIVSQDVVLCHHSCCYEQTTLVNVICCRAASSAAVPNEETKLVGHDDANKR